MNTKIDELIGKSISGGLSEAEQAELNSWIASSPENAEEYNAICGFLLEKEDLPSRLQEEDWTKLLVKINTVEKQNRIRPLRNLSGSNFLVAAALILAIGLVFWYKSGDKGLTEHFSGVNELFLEDGSQIILYGDGKLSIPSPFNRYVELTGSAYFIIQPDINHPFIIKTQNATVKVKGTRFTVRSQEKFTHLVVTEGKVLLNGLTGDTTVKELGAGMAGSVADSSVLRPDLDHTTSDIIQWEKNRLVFRKIPLITLMKEISLQFGVTIQIKNPEVMTQTVSGIYEFQTEEGIIQSVCSALNLQVTKEGTVYSIFK